MKKVDSNIEIEFYYNIGLLSIRFAIVEQNLQDILTKKISKEEYDAIAITLTENLGMWKKIKLLRKITKINDVSEKEIYPMLKRLEKVQKIRNLFIHGLWKSPQKEGDTITIVVESKKIIYKEEDLFPELAKFHHSDQYLTKSWQFNNHEVYTLNQIKDLILEVGNIILVQEKILSNIDKANEM